LFSQIQTTQQNRRSLKNATKCTKTASHLFEMVWRRDGGWSRWFGLASRWFGVETADVNADVNVKTADVETADVDVDVETADVDVETV